MKKFVWIAVAAAVIISAISMAVSYTMWKNVAEAVNATRHNEYVLPSSAVSDNESTEEESSEETDAVVNITASSDGFRVEDSTIPVNGILIPANGNVAIAGQAATVNDVSILVSEGVVGDSEICQFSDENGNAVIFWQKTVGSKTISAAKTVTADEAESAATEIKQLLDGTSKYSGNSSVTISGMKLADGWQLENISKSAITLKSGEMRVLVTTYDGKIDGFSEVASVGEIPILGGTLNQEDASVYLVEADKFHIVFYADCVDTVKNMFT